jgi:hypothetical protein
MIKYFRLFSLFKKVRKMKGEYAKLTKTTIPVARNDPVIPLKVKRSEANKAPNEDSL